MYFRHAIGIGFGDEGGVSGAGFEIFALSNQSYVKIYIGVQPFDSVTLQVDGSACLNVN